jgi:hypothetical protein
VPRVEKPSARGAVAAVRVASVRPPAARRRPAAKKSTPVRPSARAAAAPRETGRRPARVPFGALGFALAALACAWAPLAVSRGAPWLWQGYRPLLVRSGSGPDLALVKNPALLGPEAISAASAPVQFWDFSGFAHVNAGALPSRLDPLDPRYDPWIAGLPSWFTAGPVTAPAASVAAGAASQWKIVYIPASMSLVGAALRAARAFGVPFRGEWALPEFDLRVLALALAAVAAFAALSALALSRARRTALAVEGVAAAMAAPLVVAAGIPGAAAACMLLAAWHPVLAVLLGAGDDTRHRPVRRLLVIYGGAAVAANVLFVVARPPAASVAALVGLCTGLPLLLAALPLVGAVRSRDRRLFHHVPLVRPSRDRGRRRAIAPVAATVLLAAALVVAVAGAPALPAPRPAGGGREFSFASLASLERARRTDAIPDAATFVTHAAYQESLAFGRPWRLPEQGERVTVVDYASSAGTVTAAERTVKRFDDAWLAGVQRRAGAGTLEALLFAQGRPVAVRRLGPLGRLAGAFPLLLAAVGLLLGARPLIRAASPRFNGRARRSKVP